MMVDFIDVYLRDISVSFLNCLSILIYISVCVCVCVNACLSLRNLNNKTRGKVSAMERISATV